MAKTGGKSPGGSLASLRFSSEVRQDSCPVARTSSVVVSSVPRVSRSLHVSGQTGSSGKHSRSTVTKELHNRNASKRKGVLFSSFPCPEKIRRVASGDRFIDIKSVSLSSHVSDGHSRESEESRAARNVGNVAGPGGRIPSCAYAPGTFGLSLLSGGESSFQIPCVTIRPVLGAVGIYGGGETNKDYSLALRCDSFSVPRRLAESSPIQSSDLVKYTIDCTPLSCSRFVSQSREIGAVADPVYCLSRRGSQFCTREMFSDGSASLRNFGAGFPISSPRFSFVSESRVAAGAAHSDISVGTLRTPTPSFSAVSGGSAGAEGSTVLHSSPFVSTVTSRASVVAERTDFVAGSSFSVSTAVCSPVHRCVDGWMGYFLSGTDVARRLETSGVPHQLAGVESGSVSDPAPPVSSKEFKCLLLNRQFNSSSLSSKAGGHEVEVAVSSHTPHSSSCSFPQYYSSPATHSGSIKCFSGSSLPSGSSHSLGVVSFSSSVSVAPGSVTVGPSADRSVREQVESPSASVHVAVSRRSRSRNRRLKGTVAKRSSVRVSSQLSVERPSSQVIEGAGLSPSVSSSMDSPSVVDPSSQSVSEDTGIVLPSVSSPPTTTPLGLSVSRQIGGSPTDLFDDKWLKDKGFSDSVIKRLSSSRAATTNKQYKSKWVYFVHWAGENKYNPLDASLPLLTEFLDHLFRVRGISVRTISNYRSAIAFFWKMQVGYEIPEHDPVLSDLFRSFKRERPLPHKHVVGWDIALVLKYFRSGRFKNWDMLSDKDLTLKTVFLVALATGKRRGELHALTSKIKWVHGKTRTMLLSPCDSFLSKTHLVSKGLGALKPFELKGLDDFIGSEDKDDRLLCPVRTLSYYLSRSSKYRSEDQKRLFISYQRGNSKDLSKQTISKYIKDAIILAHAEYKSESSDNFSIKPHSVRHVATSLSALKNFSLDEILAAGQWVSPDVFISHYIQNFTTDDISKLSKLGGFVSAGTTF